ncbi:echinoderm microtubule-associated protein-like CG42247 [Caerostris extrusa]|uniref:Echinoderm microtubule-associated protein-like CG42247 n=1 Tax=Caerostris extrusa TaxID=172846 RepID=A0AAV4NI05_CAEEX|nr:echinoderm microtubule-associated protein-like CG42247 [Caerostris extrusa]
MCRTCHLIIEHAGKRTARSPQVRVLSKGIFAVGGELARVGTPSVLLQGKSLVEDCDQEWHDLDDLLDGYSYVVSGTKNFQELAYGQSNRMRGSVSRAHLPLTIRKEDLKLYRPVSPLPSQVWRVRTPKNLRSRSLPTQKRRKDYNHRQQPKSDCFQQSTS